MNQNLTDAHGRPTMANISIDMLICERYNESPKGYQRKGPTATWTDDRTGKDFDKDLVRPLEVADLSHEGVGGLYAVIDGQGRFTLLKEQGLTEALCHIHYDTTPKRRAELFRGLDDMRKLKYIDTFRADVRAGTKVAGKIHGIFQDAGFDLMSTNSHRVSGLSTIKHVYDDLGADVLETAVGVFRDAWRDKYLAKSSLPGQYVAGLAKIIENTNGSFKKIRPAVEKFLAKVGPNEMKTRIREDNGGKKIRTDQVPLAFAMHCGRSVNSMTKLKRNTIPLVDLSSLREVSDGKNY
jgi:hypothetical protein